MVASSTTVLLVLGTAIVALLAAYKMAPNPILPIQKNDAIVVTGTHTGIGKHAALSLAREGFVVFAGVRELKHGQELLQEASAYSEIDISKIRPLVLDVTKPEQIAQAVETVSQFVGNEHGLYGLFNNAGIGTDLSLEMEGSSVEHMPLEKTRRVFEVNYFGVLQVTKAFLPLLRQRRGRIVMNTSIAGIFSAPFLGTYSSSKFALEALSDSLRRELQPHGVLVSILQPGFIHTPILQMYQHALQGGGHGVYAAHEVQHFKGAIQNAADTAAHPRVTSQAVIHALRAKLPQTRYLVGGLSGMVWFLSLLPDQWADAVVRLGGKVTISDEQLHQAIEAGRQRNKFEL